MSNLSDYQIRQVIRKYALGHSKDAFLGVFPMDTLPRQVPHYPACMVVNTQSHNLPGEHWISVFITKDKRGEVYSMILLMRNK